MLILVCESAQFIFYAWTISRTNSGNHTLKEGRVLEAAAENVVYLAIGMDYIARHLGNAALNRGKERQVGKLGRIFISALKRKFGNIYGTDVYSGRGTSFHSRTAYSESFELLSQSVRCLLPYPSTLKRVSTYEHTSVQEGSGS